MVVSFFNPHWQMDNETISGNPDRKNEQTFSTYCLNITKSMTVTCRGITILNETHVRTGTDTGEIIMIDGVEDTDVLPTHLPSNSGRFYKYPWIVDWGEPHTIAVAVSERPGYPGRRHAR